MIEMLDGCHAFSVALQCRRHCRSTQLLLYVLSSGWFSGFWPVSVRLYSHFLSN